MRNVAVFGLSASRGSGAVRHCEYASKGSESSAMPEDGASLKEGPYPHREGTKAKVETVGE